MDDMLENYSSAKHHEETALLYVSEHAPISTRVDESSTGCLSTSLFVLVISFISGLYDISNLGLLMYQKRTLLLSTSTIQLLSGVIDVPWAIKPVFGYAFDSMLKKIKRVKYIVYATSVVRLLVYLLLAYCDMRASWFIILLMLNQISAVFENIIAEYCLVLDTQEKNRQTGSAANNELPIYFGARSLGQLIGTFLGGRIIEAYTNQTVFAVCIAFPLIALVAALSYKESRVCDRKPGRSVLAELRELSGIFKRDRVLLMVVFVCLMNTTPSFSTLNTFYLTDYLMFSTTTLANFNTFSVVSFLVGLLAYYFYFVKISPRPFYVLTSALLWVVEASFLLVVLEVIQGWGMSPKPFCFLNEGMNSLLTELQFMPVITIWIGLIPKNLEATAITFITGLTNLSKGLSDYSGAFVMWLMNVGEHNYNALWQLILVKLLYMLFILVGLLFIKFPKPQVDSAATDQNIKE